MRAFIPPTQHTVSRPSQPSPAWSSTGRGVAALSIAALATMAPRASAFVPGPLLPWGAQGVHRSASGRAERHRSLWGLGVSYMGTTPDMMSYNHTAAHLDGLSDLLLEGGEMPLPPMQAVRPPIPKPMPANLPRLSSEDLILLRAGERVQRQIRNGCMGSGYVVVDLKADAKTVWETLLDIERYADMIPTIRSVRIHSRYKSRVRGSFTLSKFRLKVDVIHEHRPEESRLDFYLDPSAPQYGNILEYAEGFWYVEDRPRDRPEGWTRVYMTATVKVNSLVPLWLVEYAAERALKRATAWLKPTVEMHAAQF